MVSLLLPIITTVTIPNTSSEVRTTNTAIEVGFDGARLSFDNAVRILIPGQAGNRAGYIRTGIEFTEIINICAADTQIAGDAVSSECKINVGSDLVIWTKHFTKFAAFTSQSTEINSRSNGTAYCSNYVYGNWGTCVNGTQTRNIVSWNGGDTCSKDYAVTKQSCIDTVEEITPIAQDNTLPFANEELSSKVNLIVPIKQVLGEKIYKDGTLLRAPNKKVYLLTNGKLLYISTLKELKKYSNREMLEVNQDTINSYVKLVLGAKKYANGSLLRGADTKIYVLVNGKKQHIKTLQEFKSKYSNRPVFNVSDEVLSQY